MSLTHNELIYLMAYVDGQVDADELPEVEALLARSEEAQQIVAQHRAMGDWVRESSEERALAGGADRIADVVLHEIDKLGGGKVIGLERERARLELNRQRIKEFSALGAVAAVAAALWLIPTRMSPIAVGPATSPAQASSVAPPASVARAPAPSPSAVGSAIAGMSAATEPSESDPVGVDVQSVESPTHPFSIFYVPAATGVNAQASSVVVWIAE